MESKNGADKALFQKLKAYTTPATPQQQGKKYPESTWVSDDDGYYLTPPGVSLQQLDHFVNNILGTFGLDPLIPETLFTHTVVLEEMFIEKGLKGFSLTLAWETGWDLRAVVLQGLRLAIRYQRGGLESFPVYKQNKKDGSYQYNKKGERIVDYVVYQEQSGYTEATLSADLQFGDLLTLVASVEMPTGFLSATLPKVNPLASPTVGGLAKHLNLPTSTGKPPTSADPEHHLKINSLDVSANVLNGRFLFHVGVQDALNIKLHSSSLVIEQIQLDINHRSGAQGQTTGRLFGKLIVGGTRSADGKTITANSGWKTSPVIFTLLAELKPSGWLFAGSMSGINTKAKKPTLKLSDFITNIEGLFLNNPPQPPAIFDNLLISFIAVSFNTATKDFNFSCDVAFPKSGMADLKLHISFTNSKGANGEDNYTRTFSGSLIVAQQEFDLVFSQQKLAGERDNILIADYQNLSGPQLNLGGMLSQLSPSVPDFAKTLNLNLKNALLTYVSSQKQGVSSNHTIFTANLGVGVDLTSLPLVSRFSTSPNNTISAQFQPTMVTHIPSDNAKKETAVKALNTIVPTINGLVPNGGMTVPTINGSFQLLTLLNVAGQQLTLSFGATAGTKSVATQVKEGLEKQTAVQPNIIEGELIETPAPVNLEKKLEELVHKLETSTEQLPDAELDALYQKLHELEEQLATGAMPDEPIALTPDVAEAEVAPDGKTLPTDTSQATWIDVQKTLGPVHIQRIGALYDKGRIWFLLDASLSAAGLSLEINGLGASVSLSEVTKGRINPTFTLRGIGLDFSDGGVEIGGEFLRNSVRVPGVKEPVESYDGMLRVKFEELTLAAIGSYAHFQGHNSVFVYLTVDYPLGGPAFFFVTGVAGGFGYNRRFIAPTIDNVLDFPLVAEATGTPQSALTSDSQNRFDRLNTEMGKLQQYMPPRVGSHFIAAGIRYSTFELFDSFTMLEVTFGQRVEINLLGITTAVLPTPEAGSTIPNLAEVQIQVKAAFVPDKGRLSVEARLTRNSYIFSQSCILTGGLAFYAWFKDQANGAKAGDFVFTLGGYHKMFKPPTYYPRVPQLGFSWQVSTLISVKGNAYFALTPNAMMAGGHLEALWKSGPLSAWFKAGADFLLGWKPFTYDAKLYISIGASLVYHFFGTHHVTVELGGNLHLWGPKFSGKVQIKYYIVSVTVSFGDDKPQAKPINWKTFRTSFLPSGKKKAKPVIEANADIANARAETLPRNLVSAAVNDGLVKTIKEQSGERWVINPKTFQVTAVSTIPVTTFNLSLKDEAALKVDPDPKKNITVTTFGIAPMGISDATSTMTITIRREGKNVNEKFFVVEDKTKQTRTKTLSPIKKSLPAAMWGNKFDPDLNGERMVDDLCTGLIITPAATTKVGHSQKIDKKNLLFAAPTPLPVARLANHNDLLPTNELDVGKVGEQSVATINKNIEETAVVQARIRLLESMGIENPLNNIHLGAAPANNLILA